MSQTSLVTTSIQSSLPSQCTPRDVPSPAPPPLLTIYRFAYTAAPPNRAPKPIAAVLAGGAGLPVAAVALAPVAVAVAESRRELTFALRELVRPLSSEEREEAAAPVAVARTAEMDEARAPASLVMEARSDDAADRRLETAEPRGSVSVCVPVAVISERMLPPAEVAPAIAEEKPAPREDQASDAVSRMPPGWVESSVLWAWRERERRGRVSFELWF